MIINALVSLLSLALLCLLFFRLFPEYFVDVYRSRLFALRHRLFMMAARDDTFDFDSDAYKLLEHHLNIGIRYAHRSSFLQILVFRFLHRVRFGKRKIPNHPSVSRLEKAVREVQDEDVRRSLNDIQRSIDSATVKLLTWRSPLLFLIVAVLMAWAVISLLVNHSKKRIWSEAKRDVRDNEFVQTAKRNYESQAELVLAGERA